MSEVAPASSEDIDHESRGRFKESLLQNHSSTNADVDCNSPLITLTLRHEQVLDTTYKMWMYKAILFVSRVAPCAVIYGGTLSFLICVFYMYRWGVLFALSLYAVFMLWSSWMMAICAFLGLFRCWTTTKHDWYSMYLEEADGAPVKQRSLPDQDVANQPPLHGLRWCDVVHYVIVPNYKTPYEILAHSVRAVRCYRWSRTNMVLVLACEERDETAAERNAEIRKEFGDDFFSICETRHPSGIPKHIKGKASNVCWSFSEVVKQLHSQGFTESDQQRMVVTIIDDDSEMHERYFEALTYNFLASGETKRHLTIWQCPIVHFKNYKTQPGIVRVASLFASLHELSSLANPLDVHVPFSSYSLSFVLASGVGGFDPDWLAEDWHMLAKCSLMTEGRASCEPIFLPLMNYAPEEETWWKTIRARWTQAKRHSLGVSEIVYVWSSLYVGLMQLPTWHRVVRMLYRCLPLAFRLMFVHFEVSTLGVWPILGAILIHYTQGMEAWCSVSDLDNLCSTCCVNAGMRLGYFQDQIVKNSWAVFIQTRASAGLVLGLFMASFCGPFYFQLVKKRVDGDVNDDCFGRNICCLIARTVLELLMYGGLSAIFFGAIPEWMAVVTILTDLSQDHAVAAMKGRPDEDV